MNQHPQLNWRHGLPPFFLIVLACAVGGRTISDMLAPLLPLLIGILLLALVGSRILRRW